MRLGDTDVDPRWPSALLSGALAVTGITTIEILAGSRNAPEFANDRSDLQAMPRLPINEQVIERARVACQIVMLTLRNVPFKIVHDTTQYCSCSCCSR